MGEGWEGVKLPEGRCRGEEASNRRRPRPTAGLTTQHDDAERSLWQILRSAQIDGHRSRRQVPFGRYIADFVCHDARLIIELDGGQHEEAPPQEAERSRFLQHQGYRILRFWNNEVLSNLDGVHATIAKACGSTTPTQPSPIEGEGFRCR